MKYNESIPFDPMWCSIIAADLTHTGGPRKRFVEEYESNLCYRRCAKDLITDGNFYGVTVLPCAKRTEGLKIASVLYYLLYADKTPKYTKLVMLFGKEYGSVASLVSEIYKNEKDGMLKLAKRMPSRNVFDAIIGLLPEDKVDNAVNTYAIQVRGAISRYFCCRSKWVKEEKKCLDEIHRLDDELNKVSDEANAFSKKTHSMVKAKAMPLAKNNMPGVGAKAEMTIGLHSIAERGETIVAKLEAMQTKLQKLNELERDFAYDSAECSYWTEETWTKKYSTAVAKRAVKFEVMDPYAVCFAFYYMIDNGDNLPWLYYPSCVLLSHAAAQLPWCGGAVKQCVDATGQTAFYIDANTAKLHLMEDNLTSDSSVVPICWNTMSLVQQEGADAKTPVRMTPAAAVYTYTDGVLVPRNTASADPIEATLADLGVTAPEGRAVYAAYIPSHRIL